MFVITTEKLINLSFVYNTNMDSEKDILKENIKKFLNSAWIVYQTKDYTSAAILYFKAMFAIFDIDILIKLGRTPKDHSERFRILGKNFPNSYAVLDKLYPIYRGSYTLITTKQECDEVKQNVEIIVKEQRIL